jgi:isocitrate dehydrogenase
MSQEGSKIELINGKLTVPNDPIIPFIEVMYVTRRIKD